MKERGITLVEIVVVIFLISMLLMVLFSNFPKIQRQFALSRAVHKFTQDARKAEDLALSGSAIVEGAKGYGIYIQLNNNVATEYIIYADKDGNLQYEESEDDAIETVSLGEQGFGVQIASVDYIEPGSQGTSINFSPPNPAVEISNLEQNSNRIGIVFNLKSEPENQRTVYIYTSGLIETK